MVNSVHGCYSGRVASFSVDKPQAPPFVSRLPQNLVCHFLSHARRPFSFLHHHLGIPHHASRPQGRAVSHEATHYHRWVLLHGTVMS